MHLIFSQHPVTPFVFVLVGLRKKLVSLIMALSVRLLHLHLKEHYYSFIGAGRTEKREARVDYSYHSLCACTDVSKQLKLMHDQNAARH